MLSVMPSAMHSIAASALHSFAPSAVAVMGTPHLARLDWVDGLVIAIYFAIVVFIGFYLKGSSNTSEEFFMAG
ncbi:MAG: hypothetical protein ACR2JE_12690, partial [Acidobacteriaceae bacterium]